jgi:hypothetical protein
MSWTRRVRHMKNQVILTWMCKYVTSLFNMKVLTRLLSKSNSYMSLFIFNLKHVIFYPVLAIRFSGKLSCINHFSDNAIWLLYIPVNLAYSNFYFSGLVAWSAIKGKYRNLRFNDHMCAVQLAFNSDSALTWVSCALKLQCRGILTSSLWS